jgi:hypothetical protein
VEQAVAVVAVVQNCHQERLLVVLEPHHLFRDLMEAILQPQVQIAVVVVAEAQVKLEAMVQVVQVVLVETV